MSSSAPAPAEAPESEMNVVKGLTTKEIKKLAKPEFAADPDRFYPTKTLRALGFSRNSCPECGNNYWRASESRKTCGDSQCEKKYSFIGVGTGVGRGENAKKLTYAEAWEGFRRSLTSARVPCTAIPRYPVVARWRADVDYVAAGIFCFQPYCVTGELAPPANPLICPQFCLRFNDLDNIGLTGRHYSGFVMLGIQVFNKPDDRKFWMDECVEFNYRWLTEELKIDPAEITFIEDVWAGGGNLGPSIEYFVGGLELGNMVFMQYKTFPDGSREPLQVQVIDVGIGLERVPWLINGSPTSYVDVFPSALKLLQSKTGQEIQDGVWKAFGPLSCLLNVDEVDDVDKIWDFIGGQIGMAGSAVKQGVEPVRDLYKILDHTRSVLMAITDGSLPSNVGGAANVRNILRNVFTLLKKRGWWEKLGMEGLLELFECHKRDLALLYGEFPAYKSFNPIIELEYKRWLTTDEEQKTKLQRLIKARKGKPLTIEDWILCVTSHGIPAETVAQLTGQEVPGKLWLEVAEMQERNVKVAPTALYQTAHLPETRNLYLYAHKEYRFTGKILEIIPNIQAKNAPSIVVLDQSAFYPTSGGQEHDTGLMWIDGVEYNVVDVLKVGPAVLHVIEPPLPINDKRPDLKSYVGIDARGEVNEARRDQLRNHHTATHIVFASCRRVLGPHVWQNGAKKTVHQAHLDITHYSSLSDEEIMNIQDEANRIVQSAKPIKKGHMAKDEAEKKFGFHLYQGGIVPGNQLRVVQIEDTDTEACCGTHSDSTIEVCYVKIIKAARISDGIVRLYFVAGQQALAKIREETRILNQLESIWSVGQDSIVQTAHRFFNEAKKFSNQASSLSQEKIGLQVENTLLNPKYTGRVFTAEEPDVTLHIAIMPGYSEQIKAAGKAIAYIGETWMYILSGKDKAVDLKALESFILSTSEAEEKRKAANAAAAGTTAAAPAKGMKFALQVKDTVSFTKLVDKKKTAIKVADVAQVVAFSLLHCTQEHVVGYFKSIGFLE